ncbi:hypothetical protein Poli38472_010839 [Pythium oligandrum]|uniref:Putative auto-transporter adhesin head GIN domain-containing protein n=1 Tax=Pythium oligandrum TaxID=41045 RepID=A0A8K1CE62_PYTOL|nr:hypothetical protein Poli38472_010839 [Pythium oligandrum]|eukprot:TMW61776.1 hypothetical protein Poli38472_010839 [Pythium oligandrum]
MKFLYHSLVAAALGLSAAADAWTITSSETAKPSTSQGEHLDLVKVWTISGDQSLSSLEVHHAGPTFVDYDEKAGRSRSAFDSAVALNAMGEREAARVLISGNSRDLIESVEVVEVNTDGIKIRYKNEGVNARGYLLTQVIVGEKQVLSHVSASGSGTVVFRENVLVQDSSDKSLDFKLSGSGDVLLATNSPVSLGSLGLLLSGSGDVQIQTPSLTLAEELQLKLSGSGDISIIADHINVKDKLETHIAGSGTVLVEGKESVVTKNLKTVVSGSGDVSFSKQGSCEKQEVLLSGSGDVTTGAIACVDTEVRITGSGDVLVQTSNDLTVSPSWSGSVKYVNARPQKIELTRHLYGSLTPDKVVKQASKNRFTTPGAMKVPAFKPAYIVIHRRSSWFWSEPSIDVTFGDDDDYSNYGGWKMPTQNLAVFAAQTPHTLAGIAFVGFGLAAVGMAGYKAHQRRVREQYAPLL